MRHKIVLMAGGTETLEYFSCQLKKGFEELGYKTFLFDQTAEEESAEALYKFADSFDTILVTFNFDGIHYETSLFDVQGISIWDKKKIPCVNIVVDHPFYYPELFEIIPNIYYSISIDRYHAKYLKKYYPDIKSSMFLPLGGTPLFPDGSFQDIASRPYDIIFTGNYTPPEEFDQYIMRNGEEYADFYNGIIDDLISHPDQPCDLVLERHIYREIPDATKDQMREVLPNMIFIDTYIRFYFRGLVIKTLIDNGLKVHCVGKGWERLCCRHPENLTYSPYTTSKECLEAISQSKISLNVMPWFKDGAHDRIFNSMLNGAVCLTDHSKYLDEILSPNKNVVFYGLKQLEMLPFIVKNLLSDNSHMEMLQQDAFVYALENHTWKQRARTLHNELLKFL